MTRLEEKLSSEDTYKPKRPPLIAKRINSSSEQRDRNEENIQQRPDPMSHISSIAYCENIISQVVPIIKDCLKGFIEEFRQGLIEEMHDICLRLIDARFSDIKNQSSSIRDEQHKQKLKIEELEDFKTFYSQHLNKEINDVRTAFSKELKLEIEPFKNNFTSIESNQNDIQIQLEGVYRRLRKEERNASKSDVLFEETHAMQRKFDNVESNLKSEINQLKATLSTLNSDTIKVQNKKILKQKKLASAPKRSSTAPKKRPSLSKEYRVNLKVEEIVAPLMKKKKTCRYE